MTAYLTCSRTDICRKLDRKYSTSFFERQLAQHRQQQQLSVSLTPIAQLSTVVYQEVRKICKSVTAIYIPFHKKSTKKVTYVHLAHVQKSIPKHQHWCQTQKSRKKMTLTF